LNPIPPVTKTLLWILGIAFLLQQLNPDLATWHLALWPWGEFRTDEGFVSLFQPWQLITYALLHGSFVHLFFNAFALIQFGPRLEYSLGQKRYIQFLLVCTLGAAICQLAVGTAMVNAGGHPFPTVGASGFVYGILLAWAVMYPRDRVLMILPPMEVSVRTMVLIFGGLELLMGITGTAQGVAHFAHLGGMLFGRQLLRYWQGKPPFGKRRPPPPPKPRHLRSVN
jgi:membrane associated rhomboid family serine protease